MFVYALFFKFAEKHKNFMGKGFPFEKFALVKTERTRKFSKPKTFEKRERVTNFDFHYAGLRDKCGCVYIYKSPLEY